MTKKAFIAVEQVDASLSNQELTREEVKVLTELHKKYAFGASMGFPLKEASQEIGMDAGQLEDCLLRLKRKGFIEELILPLSSNTVNSIIEEGLDLEFERQEGTITENDYQKRRTELVDWARSVSRVEFLDSIKTWFNLQTILDTRKATMSRMGVACSSRHVRTDITPEVYNVIVGQLNDELVKVQRETKAIEDDVWKRIESLVNKISTMRSEQKVVAAKHDLGVMSKSEADQALNELEEKANKARKLAISMLRLVSVPLVNAVVPSQELSELKRREQEILGRLEELSEEEERIESEVRILQEILRPLIEEATPPQTEVKPQPEEKSELEKLQEKIKELTAERDKLIQVRGGLEEAMRKGEEYIISLEAEFLMGRVSDKKYGATIKGTKEKVDKAKQNLETVSNKALELDEELLRLETKARELSTEVRPEGEAKPGLEEAPKKDFSEEKAKLQAALAKLEKMKNEASFLNSEQVKVRADIEKVSRELPKEARPDLQAFVRAREEDGMWADRMFDSKCLKKESYDFFISCIRADIFQAEKLKAYQAMLVLKTA